LLLFPKRSAFFCSFFEKRTKKRLLLEVGAGVPGRLAARALAANVPALSGSEVRP
jgi:hypothetical protein